MTTTTTLPPLGHSNESDIQSNATPSTCISVALETPPLKIECRFSNIYTDPAVAANSAPGQTDEHCIASHESFEVKQVKDIKEVLPDWDDHEVDELMVLSPKIAKPRVLSMIRETAEPLYDPEPVTSNDFDMACPFPGTEGEVVIARRKGTLDLYFVKAHVKHIFGHDDGSARKARRELEVLRALAEHDVPFTTRLYWSYHDVTAFFLVTTFCPGGDLRTLVEHSGPIPPDNARIYAAEIVEAIGTLHELNIVHRDIKPGSVFIGADGHVVLSGFERALFVSDDGVCILDGSIVLDAHEAKSHQAPEIVLGWVHDFAVDWWGLGVVLFFMLTGQDPFYDKDDVGGAHPDLVRSRILHEGLGVDPSASVDPAALDLIWKCLQRNPLFRIDVHHVLAHPYFADVDWEQVRANKVPAPPVPDLHKEIIAGAKGSLTGPCYTIETTIDESFSYTWEPGNADPGDTQATSREIREETTGTTGTMDMELDSTSRTRPQSAASPLPTVQEPDGDFSIPAEFGGLPTSDGVVEHKTRFGTLRKYSSLNFDEDHATDTLPSAPSVNRTNSSGASAYLGGRLRMSQSAYSSPLSTSPDATDSPRSRNKLRKKARPDSTPTPVLTPQPRLDLPDGIEQIGNGIGYTRRSEPTGYTRLSLSTLTPRSCHALFAGGAHKHANARKRVGAAAPRGVAVMGSANASEDQMDAVMHEMYGSAWHLGVSAPELSAAAADPRAYAAEARPGVGLGWGEGLGRGVRRAAPPEELATLSPDSTLRLVSPSTPRLEFY